MLRGALHFEVLPLTAIPSVVTAIAAVAISAGCARVPAPLSDGPISTTYSVAPSPIALTPNDRGYVRVETESKSTNCSVTTELVACQTSSDNWRAASGQRYHTVSVNADGSFHWVQADLGEMQGRVRLDYQTYSAQGWKIDAGPVETKFTNDRSGHGMSVNDQRVTAF